MSRLTEEIHAYCEAHFCEAHFISIQDEVAITSILEKRDKQLAEKIRTFIQRFNYDMRESDFVELNEVLAELGEDKK